MASFTLFGLQDETTNSAQFQVRNFNSVVNLPSPSHLGQLGLSRRLFDATRTTTTSSRRVHIHTVVDFDPVMPNTSVVCPFVLRGSHQHHGQQVSSTVESVVTHEVLRTHQAVVRTQLLHATSNAQLFLGHQNYNDHVQIQYNPGFQYPVSLIPNQTPRSSVPRRYGHMFPYVSQIPSAPVAMVGFENDGDEFCETQPINVVPPAQTTPNDDQTKEPTMPTNFEIPNPSNSAAFQLNGNGKRELPPSDDDDDGQTHSLPYRKYGPYTCPRCKGVFETSQLFAAHMPSVHYKNESQEERSRRLAAKYKNKRSKNDLIRLQPDNTVSMLPHETTKIPRVSTHSGGGDYEQGVTNSEGLFPVEVKIEKLELQ